MLSGEQKPMNWYFYTFYILLQLPPNVCAVDGARELLNHLSD